MAALIELLDLGVRVWEYKTKKFVKLSGAESIVTYVQAVASEDYVTKLRTNITAGLKRRAAEGRATTGAALGYVIETNEGSGKRWVIDPKGAEVVRHVAELFLATQSLAATARMLNVEGVRSSKGKSWGHAKVSQLLKRPSYRGWTMHAGMR